MVLHLFDTTIQNDELNKNSKDILIPWSSECLRTLQPKKGADECAQKRFKIQHLWA